MPVLIVAIAVVFVGGYQKGIRGVSPAQTIFWTRILERLRAQSWLGRKADYGLLGTLVRPSIVSRLKDRIIW